MKNIIKYSWLMKPATRMWVYKEHPDLCFPVPTSEHISPQDKYVESVMDLMKYLEPNK